MNVIIGKVDDKMKKFIRNQKLVTYTIVIDKMCNVKYITDPINVFIPFNRITKIGLVEGTLVHLPELAISTNIIKIYYSNLNNKEYLDKFAKQYNLKIEYLDLTN